MQWIFLWRDYNIEQNALKYCFYIILRYTFFILNIREVKEMLTKEDLQAIAGLLVPIETRIGNLESRFDRLENRFDSLESRFDSFESETKSRFENLEANLRSVDKHVCELDASVSELQRSVRELWLHVENTTDWKIQVVAEKSFQSFAKAGRTTKEMGDTGQTFIYVNKA